MHAGNCDLGVLGLAGLRKCLQGNDRGGHNLSADDDKAGVGVRGRIKA
jgi:hypothetical protein